MGTIEMENIGQPTKRTNHMDMQHFAIQSWVKQDLLRLTHIPTCDNVSDSLTQNVSCVL